MRCQRGTKKTSNKVGFPKSLGVVLRVYMYSFKDVGTLKMIVWDNEGNAVQPLIAHSVFSDKIVSFPIQSFLILPSSRTHYSPICTSPH